MRLTLVGPLIEENLAVGYLVASLRAAGHRAEAVSFVEDREHTEVARRVLATRPDAVGFSMTFQSRAAGFIALAEDLRAFGFKGHLTAGGHFASLAAEELLSEHGAIDSVIRGEAEAAMVALAGALERGEPLDAIPGIVARADGGLVAGPKPTKVANLDELPRPVREGPPRRELGLGVAPLVSSRGCRGRCAYCSIAAFGRLSHGPARRERSPEDLAAEMNELWRERDVEVFVFHDDDFFAGARRRDLARLRALAGAMRSMRMPRVALSIKARPDDLDPEVLALLRELGLLQVVLGIDNDSPAALRSLDRCLPPDAQRRALTLLHDLGVCVGSNLLLWAPEATGDDLRHNLALMRAFPHQLFNLGRAEPYEGAPLTMALERQGRLLGSYFARDYAMTDPVAELSWQLFRRTLAERCYRPDGLMQTAIRLDWWGHLLAHFVPAERTSGLRDEVARITARVARSNLDWLSTILDAAEAHAKAAAPGEIAVALAPPLRESIAVEDAELSARARQLMQELLTRAQHARGAARSRPVSRPAPGLQRCLRAAGMFAACTCAACVLQQEPAPAAPQSAPPHTAPAPGDLAAPPPDQQGGAGAQGEREFAKPPPDQSPPARPVPEQNDIQFRLEAVDVDSPQCGGCSYAMGVRILSYRVFVTAPAGLEFERFDLKGGTLSAVTISPDGRRVWGKLHAGGTPGNYRIAAVFKSNADGRSAKRTQEFRVSSADELRCEPGPCSDPPGPMPYDRLPNPGPAGPPKLKALHRAGKVVFTVSNRQTGRDPNGVPVIDFGVGLKLAGKAKPASGPAAQKEVPEITCSDGHIVAVERAEVAGLRDWFRVTYSPGPANGGRERAGEHTCTVRYRTPTGKGGKPYEGTFPIQVADDGTPTLVE